MYAVEQLRAFFAECRQRRTPVALVLFPHVDPSLSEGRYIYAYLHERVLAACRAEGVDCLDLRATFAKVPDYRRLWASPFDPNPSPLARPEHADHERHDDPGPARYAHADIV